MPGEGAAGGPRAEHERWVRQARRDLEDARFAAEGGRHALACFLCHQFAEKAVTSYLYARGAEHVWGHALADLCEDAMALDPSFDLLKSSAALLDKHYLGARYPSALPGGIPADAYDATDAARALAIAEEVARFIDARMADVGGSGAG
ncbi:MAG: HEPN domain-containing protein [Chloroflexi bacterium]|nr:HEPN domain-containing protein [Chloroflexota bacterium]